MNIGLLGMAVVSVRSLTMANQIFMRQGATEPWLGFSVQSVGNIRSMKMHFRKAMGAMVIATSTCLIFAAPANAEKIEILVGAAMLFHDSFQEVVDEFEAAVPSDEYVFKPDYRMTSALVNDINAYLNGTGGTNYSLFISADVEAPKGLYETWRISGKVYCVDDCPAEISAGKLLIWSNKSGIDASSGLSNIAEGKSLSLCEVDNPYGKIAQAYIDDSGKTYVETHEAGIIKVNNDVKNLVVDAGFVPTALHCDKDSNPPGGVQFDGYANPSWYVYPNINQQAAVLIKTTDSDADARAAAFLEWLQSDDGQAAMKKYCLQY